MKQTTAITLKLALATLLFSPLANAEYVADANPAVSGNQPGSLYKPLTLTGTTKSEGWEKLTSALYPGNGTYPGASAWVGALGSQVGASAGANGLAKIANGATTGGGPYPASSSIYFGGSGSTPDTHGGTLAVNATGTGFLSGVKTVLFHLDIGEAWTYDLYNDVAPVLYYTTSGGTFARTALAGSRYAKVANGQVLMNGVWEDLYINSRIYQFNLDGISGITSFSVRFDGVEHAQVHGTGLQQSTTVNTSSILPANIP